MNLISRETYKKVKRMDREAMNAFLCEIYDMGAKDCNVSLDTIMEKISTIQGIGEKRIKLIKETLSPLFEETDEKEPESSSE